MNLHYKKKIYGVQNERFGLQHSSTFCKAKVLLCKDEKLQMQPLGCKAGGNTNFLFILIAKPNLKIHYQATTNRNNTFIVRLRLSFQLAKSIKPLKLILKLQNCQDGIKFIDFF